MGVAGGMYILITSKLETTKLIPCQRFLNLFIIHMYINMYFKCMYVTDYTSFSQITYSTYHAFTYACMCIRICAYVF